MSDSIKSEQRGMPSGWRCLTVDGLKSNEPHSCIGGPFGSNLTTRDYTQTGVPVIRGTNLSTAHGRFRDEGFVFVSERKAKTLSQNTAYPNDLIFTQRGTLGQVGHIPLNPRFRKYIVSQSQMKLTPDGGIADVDFLFHSFSSPAAICQIKGTVESTGVPHITLGILRRLPVMLPSLPEQHKIARILTTLDGLIERTEALICKYQSIKQGMMHDLFTRGVDPNGKLRPSYEQAPQLYKNSDLGWIPKEWEAKRLGEKLIEVEGHLQTGPFGSMLHSYEYVTEGVPVIMPQEIINGVVVTKTIARITPEKASQMRRHWVNRNDVVFSRRGDLCRAAAVGVREVGWICGTGCFLLRVSKDAIDAKWLSYLYRHPFIQRQVDANAVGSTMPSLNNSVMERLRFTFPPIIEQREIARRISVIDRSMKIEEEQLTKLSLTKSGLMQDLLTGKVRVSVDEAEEGSR